MVEQDEADEQNTEDRLEEGVESERDRQRTQAASVPSDSGVLISITSPKRCTVSMAS